MFVGLRKYHGVTIGFQVFDSKARILGAFEGMKTTPTKKKTTQKSVFTLSGFFFMELNSYFKLIVWGICLNAASFA